MKRKDKQNSFHWSVSRRSFLKKSAMAAATLTVKPSALFAATQKPPLSKSIVAVSENVKAITDSYKIYPVRVREMIDEGIKAITNTKS
jgi:hypothetical protein